MQEQDFLRRRRKTASVKVGNLRIGGNAPIVVQSMTDTNSADIQATTAQIIALARAGAEMVRITVNNEAAAQAVPEIAENIRVSANPVPLVGDFHFNGHRLLKKNPECGRALDKLRINPGNVGKGKHRDPQFAEMIEFCCRNDKPVRIGVNWGSLDQALLARRLDENNQRTHPHTLEQIMRDTLIESSLESAAFAEQVGLPHECIIVSCKLSNVSELVKTYRQLAARCDYPLHLGLTEAGMGRRGTVASTAALSILLQEGIGDTIRISLTPEPGSGRTEEVRVAWEILQSLGLRSFSPAVIACPGCGRTNSSYFRELASEIQHYTEQQMPKWKKTYSGVENMTVAVMGCVVNGPGESKHADIGISLPGSGERPVAPVYINGEKYVTLKGETIAEDFKRLIENYVGSHYPLNGAS